MYAESAASYSCISSALFSPIVVNQGFIHLDYYHRLLLAILYS